MAGEIALQLQDQGWRGLLPLLPHDATPNVRLAADKAAEVSQRPRQGAGQMGEGRVVAAARLAQSTPTMRRRSRSWSSWPGVNVGLRACHAAPWVAFIDVDVLHHEAAGEIQACCARLLRDGEFLPRIGNAPKFLIPVQVTEPVRKARSDRGRDRRPAAHGRAAGQGQQAVVAGIHPKTGRPYVWPAGGLEETEPAKLPLVTPGELAEILAACSKILLRYGPAVGRKGRSIRSEFTAQPKPLRRAAGARSSACPAAAEFVVNADWSRDDLGGLGLRPARRLRR